MTCSRWAPVLAAAAVLAACSAAGDGAPSPQGRWTAQAIAGHPVADPARTTLEIGADGRAFGIGGCNRYSGAAHVSGAAIALGPMAATRMACPPPQMDQEQRFFEALATVARWRIEDRALLLLDGEGKVAVRLAPAPAG